MEQSNPPALVRLSEGLGPNLPERERLRAAQAELVRLRAENAALKREAYTWWRLAASAPQDERKRCAAVCKAQAERWTDDRARYAALECAKAIESQVPT